MGRVRIRVERLDTSISRQTTFSKRRKGLMKKASDLATLCDVDLAALAFSPAGKPSLCVGERSDLASIVEKISKMTVKERSTRKCMTLDVLQKIYKGGDNEIDPRKFSNDRAEREEEMKGQLKQLQQNIIEKSNKLRAWMNPESIDELVPIKAMEKTLMESLNRLQIRKDYLMERRSRRNLSSAMIPHHRICLKIADIADNLSQDESVSNLEVHRVQWIPTLTLFGSTTIGFSHQRNLLQTLSDKMRTAEEDSD